VIPHLSLAVVDLQQPRIHHSCAGALHLAVDRHALAACNGCRIARCCCRCGAVNCRNAIAALRLAAQPRNKLNLLRERQVLRAAARAAGQLLVQRLHRREVVCDRGIFVQPGKVAAAQVHRFVFGRKARRTCEGESAVGALDVEGYVRGHSQVGDYVGGRGVCACAEDGGARGFD
jgi:hypothetical protein